MKMNQFLPSSAAIKDRLRENRGNVFMFFGSVALGIGIFVLLKKYNYLQKMRGGENQEFVKVEMPKGRARLYFVHASWCPHSQRATPEWNSYRAFVKADPVLINLIQFEEIDSDSESAKDKLNDIEAEEGVVPSVRLSYGGRLIKYEGRITHKNLESFVNNYVTLPDDTSK